MIQLGISLGILIIGAFIGGYLKKPNNEKEYIYVDTTGTGVNPPIKYIDVELNKTINFKLDKWVISICHLPIKYNIKYIDKIKTIYDLIVKESDYIPANKTQEFTHSVRTNALYYQATLLIYELSSHFVKDKRKYKRALFKKSKESSDFVMDIIEQTVDFWLYRKKKALMLSQAQTLLSMVGSAYTWNSLNLDSHGKRLIKPRYAKRFISHGTETKKLKDKTT